tara:strand:- start:53 stop:1306 length:1254 start_codon:yes stop_codon:yes gene_type:complete
MKKNILLKGPLLSRSGYGEQSRFALRSLQSRPDLFEVWVVNISWGQTGQQTCNDKEHQWLINRMQQTAAYAQGGGTFDISIQVTVPNEFETIAPVNIGYTAGIETTKCSGQWIEKINNMVDRVITISSHSQKVMENTTYDVKDQHGNEIKDWGITVPVGYVNYPHRETTPEPLDLNIETENNFLAVAQWSPRKNLENTVKWFVEKFKDDPTCGLILKTNLASDSIIDRQHTIARIEGLLQQFPDRQCKIHLIHGEVTPGNLTWLYQHPTMKALINIAHGEGFGLPLFEAVCNGLPVITVTWSGQLDFITKPNKSNKAVPRVLKVDYDLNKVQSHAVWPGVIEADSMWAYAREASFKRALGEVLEKEAHWKKEAGVLQKHALATFTPENMYAEFVKQVYDPSPEEIEWMEQMEDIQIL